MEKIEAGAVSTVVNLIKKISSAFLKVLNSLIDAGVEIVSQDVTKDGGAHVVMRYNNQKAEVTLTPVEGKKGVFNLLIIAPDGQDLNVENVKEADIEKTVKRNLDSYFKLKQKLGGSKQLLATLQKIETASGYDIRLRKIVANYDPEAVLKVLDECIADDALCNAITQEPMTLLIAEDGDDYTIDDVTTSAAEWSMNPYTELVAYAQRVLNVIAMASVRCNCASCDPILAALQSCRYGVEALRDMLMKQSLKEFNEVPTLFVTETVDYTQMSTGDPLQDLQLVYTTMLQRFVETCKTYASGFDDGAFIVAFFEELYRLESTLDFAK